MVYIYHFCLFKPEVKGSKPKTVMGSCSRRRKDEDTHCPGFYKCLDESVLHRGKLQIPREFCWNSDGVVPQQCRLQTMSGSWNVDVKRIGREIFLEEGWEEFVVGNSLKLGEYVTLHYYGHAKFFVEIYGHNHCERSKASKTDRLLEDEDEDDVIIIDSDSDSDDVLIIDSECGSEDDVIIIDSDKDK